MLSLTPHTTLIEALRKSLEWAVRAHSGDAVPPAALLWADPDGQWQPVVDLLRPLMPELLTLGDYDPELRSGPAIWLRCAIERTLEDQTVPEDKIPILYLPHVSRQTLRAGDACPDLLKPLVELQYRGTVWAQRNGRDWTVEAFLTAEDGMALDVARDAKTQAALLRSLARLALIPVSQHWGKHLQAADFDRLLSDDTPRDLLAWLDNPEAVRKTWDAGRWTAFCSRCKAEYGFDPEKEGALTAAEKLGLQSEEKWRHVWNRFKEAPGLYVNIGQLLRRAKPAGQLLFNKEPWPDENAKEEASLRQALLSCESMPEDQARQTITRLEEQHGLRRQWVWANLGECDLAIALEPLQRLARETACAPGGATIEEMAAVYAESGYWADRSVWEALAAVSKTEDHRAVTAAIRALYLPWLEKSAAHFQQVWTANPAPTQAAVADAPKTCWLFVDGLRYDLAQRLQEILAGKGCPVLVDKRWAALPTVTATAKPAVSPIADLVTGQEMGETFMPVVSHSGQTLNSDRLSRLIAERGLAVLENDETGDPSSVASAWNEWGHFDRLGHDLGAGLAYQIEEQLLLLSQRIQELLQAGWEQVRVVTDHGWQLIPGGFPKIDLPKYLVESRWARCAAAKETAQITLPTAPWHWNPLARFVYAPDIRCFEKGHEYAHGGLSLQECLIPEMTILSGKSVAPVIITVKSIEWRGLRCRLQIEPVAGVMADLRTKPYDPASSITVAKEIDAEGGVALVVENEDLDGAVASLVIYNLSGEILAKQMTTVGGKA